MPEKQDIWTYVIGVVVFLGMGVVAHDVYTSGVATLSGGGRAAQFMYALLSPVARLGGDAAAAGVAALTGVGFLIGAGALGSRKPGRDP